MDDGMIPLRLSPSAGTPLYRQIMDGICDMVASGVLSPGAKLPSIRELSTALRINPSSAVKAYSELRHAGVIEQKQGRGTFVSQAPSVVRTNRERLLAQELKTLLARAQSWGFSKQDVLTALKAHSTSQPSIDEDAVGPATRK